MTTRMPSAEENVQAMREMRKADMAYSDMSGRLQQAEAEIDYLSCRVQELQRQLADAFDELVAARQEDMR